MGGEVEGVSCEIKCMLKCGGLLALCAHTWHASSHVCTHNATNHLVLHLNHHQLHFIRVYHCEGLVLCTATDYTRLVVWNPYSGQTRWISVESRSVHHLLSWYAHALGYDQSKSYKILRFAHPPEDSSVHEIFKLNSNSWTVLDVTPDWRVWQSHHGLSLKGNTYWFATDKESRGHMHAVTLSSLREEQLAVLFQRNDTFEMEIWVTSMIEPNAVSWSKFFAIDMEPLTCFRFYDCGTFLIDEEKRAVVVFDEDNDALPPTRDIAYVIGENGYFRQVDLGEITTNIDGHPLACSYVPSSVRID
ncbi:unnamed protein product [Arabidopsis lyrata]|nr:unnamed protein product [Arabidopsis lyrata]